MKRSLTTTLAVAMLTSFALAAPKVKVKAYVKYAPSWDAAVAEAKLLNIPIVVHAHGFN